MMLKFLPALGDGLSKEDAIKNYHNFRQVFLSLDVLIRNLIGPLKTAPMMSLSSCMLHTVCINVKTLLEAKDLWKNVLKFLKKPKRYLVSMKIIDWLILSYFASVFNMRSVRKFKPHVV